MTSDPLLLSNILPFLLVALLLLFSALVSGSEVAFFSLKPKDLEELESDDKRTSRLVLKLLKDTNEKEFASYNFSTE